MPTSLVLTVLGEDRPGLVEALSHIIAAHEGNSAMCTVRFLIAILFSCGFQSHLSAGTRCSIFLVVAASWSISFNNSGIIESDIGNYFLF